MKQIRGLTAFYPAFSKASAVSYGQTASGTPGNILFLFSEPNFSFLLQASCLLKKYDPLPMLENLSGKYLLLSPINVPLGRVSLVAPALSFMKDSIFQCPRHLHNFHLLGKGGLKSSSPLCVRAACYVVCSRGHWPSAVTAVTPPWWW